MDGKPTDDWAAAAIGRAVPIAEQELQVSVCLGDAPIVETWVGSDSARYNHCTFPSAIVPYQGTTSR